MSTNRKQPEGIEREALIERVLQRYAQIAFCRRKTFRGMPLTTSDQLVALHALGEHLGLFVHKHEVDIGARAGAFLDTAAARLSPTTRAELVRAVGEQIQVPSAADQDRSGCGR